MPTDPLTDLGTDDRARLEAVLVEFDLRWAPGRLAAAAGQLPPAGPFRAAALKEMVKIDLERLGRAGHPVSLQDHLDLFPELLTHGAVPDDLLRAAAAARDTIQHAPDTDTGPLPAPFGRYQLVRPLGRGGMGSVYLARDAELDRLVALKVPHFAPRDTAAVERFTREARAAATLNHPNVCRVYDFGRVDGVPYITMEYVEGPTLAEALAGGPFPPRRAAELARDVARALAKAHRRGVVHRDLKPANILLSRPRDQETGVRKLVPVTPDSCPLTPVVTDFGLAWRGAPTDSRLTAERVVAGTPPYMPPEQVTGEPIGPAADVYSLGAVLYERLTGRPPFTGTRSDIWTQVLTADPAPPSAVRPDVDSGLDQITRKALAKRPEDRFADMGEFADALGRWLAVPGSLMPARSPDAARGWARWRGVRAAATALALLALGAVLLRRCDGTGSQSRPTRAGRGEAAVETSVSVSPSAPAPGDGHSADRRHTVRHPFRGGRADHHGPHGPADCRPDPTPCCTAVPGTTTGWPPRNVTKATSRNRLAGMTLIAGLGSRAILETPARRFSLFRATLGAARAMGEVSPFRTTLTGAPNEAVAPQDLALAPDPGAAGPPRPAGRQRHRRPRGHLPERLRHPQHQGRRPG